MFDIPLLTNLFISSKVHFKVWGNFKQLKAL